MDAPITHNLLPALSAEAMREADCFTIEEIGIPGFTLMESAGRALAECIKNRFDLSAGQKVACLCGKGNNGGDGLVVARQLAALGANISVFMMAPPNSLSPDAAKNYSILKTQTDLDADIQVAFHILGKASSLPVDGNYDLLIDALLGTGATKVLNDRYAAIVDSINNQKNPVVAVDLPTGLHADTGAILGSAVKADLTITMGALKSGLLLGEGPVCAGAVEVVEIGIPRVAIQNAALKSRCAHVVTREAVKTWLPKRNRSAHKYSVGMSLVVAGSPGLTGAATLAATSAARSGAGAVVCATAQSIQHVLATKMTEIMTLGLPESEAGINVDLALETIQKPLNKASSLLVGCGMGSKPATHQFIRTLASQSTIPMVVDADGLNAFVGHTELFTHFAQGRWILTPHLGEFKRLAGKDVDLTDRLAIVRHYATLWNCVLILKGTPTVVSDAEGHVYINPTINAALATAGSGDVLAGLCAGFLAQGLTPIKSALAALFLGGEAANRYTEDHHPATMFASDLIEHFSIIMNHYKS